jgi:DNA-binding LytR/AlgR family response regulator
MEQKTILLVEDDYLSRRLSKKVLLENNFRVFEAKNALGALAILEKEAVSCTILDINLGEHQQDGIALGQYMKENFAVPFIYLTAYETPEIIERAVSTSPYSYLVKPFKKTELIASVEIALRKFQDSKQAPTLSVKDGEYSVNLPLDKVNYIESERNYLLFHTDEKIYKSRSTLKKIMDELPDSTFVQTHRAYIVNKSKIEKFILRSVVIGGDEIPVSLSYFSALQRYLKD